VGELRVDPASREVRVGDREVDLSAKEFALLHTLAGDPTRVFTKEELLRDVWGFKLMGTSRHGPMIWAFAFTGGCRTNPCCPHGFGPSMNGTKLPHM
jgi:hypothetical protein